MFTSSSIYSTDGVAIPMRKEVPHPQYDPQTTDNDFMVIFLERPVPAVGDNFELVKLNKNPARPYVGQSVRVMGWGDTNIKDSVSDLSDVLMKVDVDVQGIFLERPVPAVGDLRTD